MRRFLSVMILAGIAIIWAAPAGAYRTNTSSQYIGSNVPESVVTLIDAAEGKHCTGVVISSHLVLTAGHCAPGTRSVENKDYTLGAIETWVAISTTAGRGDVALLVLSSPTFVKPMPVARGFDSKLIGLRFRPYGITPEVNRGAGFETGNSALHWTRSTIRECIASDLYLLSDFFCGLSSGLPGDSGGPATISFEGERVVVGVASRGNATHDADGNPLRRVGNAGTGYAEVDLWLNDLLAWLEQLAPGYNESWLDGLRRVGISNLEFETPTCNGHRATVVGAEGDDVIAGSSRADVIVAGSGNDVVRAAGGDDVVCTERGADLIFGGGGFDYCNGGQDADVANDCEESRRM